MASKLDFLSCFSFENFISLKIKHAKIKSQFVELDNLINFLSLRNNQLSGKNYLFKKQLKRKCKIKIVTLASKNKIF